MQINKAEIVHIYENEDGTREKLSLDNPTRGRLERAYPDINIYGHESMLPKPLFRIATKKGGWVELADAVEVPGGIIYRHFSIYDKNQDTAAQFIPGVKLSPVKTNDGLFYIIVPIEK